MPKKNRTRAAKRVLAAAHDDIKYTTALRAEQGQDEQTSFVRAVKVYNPVQAQANAIAAGIVSSVTRDLRIAVRGAHASTAFAQAARARDERIKAFTGSLTRIHEQMTGATRRPYGGFISRAAEEQRRQFHEQLLEPITRFGRLAVAPGLRAQPSAWSTFAKVEAERRKERQTMLMPHVTRRHLDG